MTSAYFVAGVELVNTGGERCCACDRKAVGSSISGHPICATHAGMAAQMADEYAAEVAASVARRDPVIHKARRLYVADSPIAPERYARGHDAAHASNLEKAQRAKVIRETAVLAAMQRACAPVTSSFLAKRTKLSLATVKRTVTELCQEGRITGAKPPKAPAFLYALREDA